MIRHIPPSLSLALSLLERAADSIRSGHRRRATQYIDGAAARLAHARQALSPLDTPQTVRAVQAAVATAYGITHEELVGPCRQAHLTAARFAGIYLCRTLTGHGVVVIGAAFGGRSHGLVAHACQIMADRLTHDRTCVVRFTAAKTAAEAALAQIAAERTALAQPAHSPASQPIAA